MDFEKPLFSIIVPTRNRIDCLQLALIKIKEQTYNNYEVIVVDDGSSTEVMESYSKLWNELDDRFKLQICSNVSIAGSGASIVRNYGISVAKGQYIGFCDDDDYWCDPNHLEIAANALNTEKCDLYIANQSAVQNNSVYRDKWLHDIDPLLTKSAVFDSANNIYILHRKDLARLETFAHMNMLFVSKKIVDDVCGFWTQLRFMEDLDFYLRVLDSVRFIFYRDITVSVHNIPDRLARQGIVPPLSRFDKIILWLTVSHHVRANCMSPELIQRCNKIDRDTLYNYSVEFEKQSWNINGIMPALQSVITLPSLSRFNNIIRLVLNALIDVIRAKNR